jgi:hypothetical protein
LAVPLPRRCHGVRVIQSFATSQPVQVGVEALQRFSSW